MHSEDSFLHKQMQIYSSVYKHILLHLCIYSCLNLTRNTVDLDPHNHISITLPMIVFGLWKKNISMQSQSETFTGNTTNVLQPLLFYHMHSRDRTDKLNY